VLSGGRHDSGDVVGRLGHGDGGRALVHGEVPGLSGLVPGLIIRCHDHAGRHGGSKGK
jgi:hypothetical protein